MSQLTTPVAASEPFRFACPKCGVVSGYRIERLSSVGYGSSGKWKDRVFACMCGKRVYGDAIRLEYERQYLLHINGVEVAKRETKRVARRDAREKAKKEARRELAKAKLLQRKAEEASKRKATKKKVAATRAKALESAPDQCAWMHCEEKRRKTSIYCSKRCSNFNARKRYRDRKEKEAPRSEGIKKVLQSRGSKKVPLSQGTKLTVPSIIEAVARLYNIRSTDITGISRARTLSQPRHLAMFLARKHTELSFPDLGREFGRRDHSTVQYACRKFAMVLADDADLASKIQLIEEGLNI